MFTHCAHFHTSYSFLDGYNPIKKAVARVKELGMNACAITDHNHLGGCPEFQEECFEQGIKPILGFEGYFTSDMNEAAKSVDERKADALKKTIEAGVLTDEEAKKLKKTEMNAVIEPYMYDMHQYHIILLAKNQTGWHNLVKIQSEAARRCTYNGRYLCDMELLADHSEGVICTTACIGSFPSKMLRADHMDLTIDYILTMKEIFGEDFYLEIQPLGINEQMETNLFYMDVAKKHNIQVIATNDVHYTRKEDWDDHDTLLCIGTGKKKADTDRMRYSNDFWIKSEEEMYESFAEQMQKTDFDADDADEYTKFYKAAIENTQLIADKVDGNIKLGSDKPLFSNVQVPKGFTPETWLTQKAFMGMYKYLAKHPEYDVKEYEARLASELDIINSKGFAPYMLAVEEYVTWANENNCPTGPGRGSAAGSLALFSIGVTKNIDPIQNQLLFSRFLTADRKDPPDIDTDFEYEHRDDVIEHLKDYYGEECVAHIGTYSAMGVKSGLKDVARVLDIDFKTINDITKAIDGINDSPGLKFKDLDAMKDGDESEKKAWQDFDRIESNNKELFRLARAFEGTPRNQGVHASGVLVTPMPVTDLFPVRYKDGVAIALYTGPQLEHYGAIKYDVLGLKTISVIQKTLNAIDDIANIGELYDKADIKDKKVWKYISDKKTEGVFQVESDMMKGIIDIIRPESFDDLGAINALGRPGPLAANMPQDYGKRKNGEKTITYPIRGCEDILDNTFGTIPYQEQLMLISKKVAGFNDMQADSLTRKTIAKKKQSMMPMLIRCHIFGKKNCEGPAGWEDDMHAPWYDPKGKYGDEIPGAISNGYTEEEMLSYFHTIEKFSSYCFNKSHSACYAYIGFLTAWLKYYYPAEFMAAVLSMQDNNDDIAYYTDICEHKMGITIKTPDINESGVDFKANGKSILYGLGSVKGVGDAAIPEILANRPYASVTDAIERIPKKAFNKRIGENLIKAGAFDWYNKNRLANLNDFHAARKDKIEPYVEDCFDNNLIMEFEKESLGAYITVKPWWDDVAVGKKFTFIGNIRKINERPDKRGRLMAFPEIHSAGCDINGLMFASSYAKVAIEVNNNFMRQAEVEFEFTGKKDDKGKFLIDSIKTIAKEDEFADILEAIA